MRPEVPGWGLEVALGWGGLGSGTVFCWLGLVVRVCERGQLIQGLEDWISSGAG